MIWIQDTDVLSIWRGQTQPDYDRLLANVRRHSQEDVAVTIVSFQEICKGRLALVNGARTEAHLLRAYEQLLITLKDFAHARMLPFDRAALDQFNRLRKQGIRIGTMDLRIASIALVHGATVVTRNLRDFTKVPGLVVEDWTR